MALFSGQRFHFNRIVGIPQGYRFDLWTYATIISDPGSFTLATFIGSAFWGENIWYPKFDNPSFPNPDFYNQKKLIFVTPLGTNSFGSFFEDAQIRQYDTFAMQFFHGSNSFSGTFHLPAWPINNATVATLFFGFNTVQHGTQDNRTYWDPAQVWIFNGGTAACGTLLKRTFTDSLTVSDSSPKTRYDHFEESFPIKEFFRQNPRRYPTEIVPVYETIVYTTLRHATITDWNFMPRYKILLETTGYGTFGTTNWDTRQHSFGNIHKSIKHWTGDFEVGQWNPTFIDEVNELYGSMYATQADVRMKELQLSAMIADSPLTFIPQFRGQITNTQWQDGKVSMLLTDKLKDLPVRSFVFDYQNIGSRVANQEWGRVVKVSGTNVMFNDRADVKWIPIKKDGGNFWSAIGQGIIGAVTGAFAGGGVGAVVGGGLVDLFRGLSSVHGDEVVGAYYQITDYNAIPDNTVRSGVKVKFYAGSINGQATNLNSVLAGIREYSIQGGRFDDGYKGTFAINDTRGINVGDWVYVRKPIILTGSPNDVITALLCGSNIDYPYNKGTTQTSSGFFGSLVVTPETDFADSWDSELSPMNLFSLSKPISPDGDSDPFSEIKELCRELQISFFIDETNKFAVRTIRPRNIISTGTFAHYREGVNILDGFSFKKSVDESASGVRIYFDFAGEGIGGFNGGYNQMLEFSAPSPIAGINRWGTIESRWVHSIDDAEVIAYRFLANVQRGIDRIHIPTTLYGVIHNLLDTVKVTHRTGSLGSQLYEIEEYDKRFDESRVDLEAVGVSRLYGYGNCIWVATSIPVTTATQSGFCVQGLIGTATLLGTVNGTMSAFSKIIPVDMTINSVREAFQSNSGKFICFGSNVDSFTELCYMELNFPDPFGEIPSEQPQIRRGLFNTISRAYFPGESIYAVALAFTDQYGSFKSDSLFGTNYRTATSFNMNTNLGTAFRFF